VRSVVLIGSAEHDKASRRRRRTVHPKAQLEWAQMTTAPIYEFNSAEVLFSFDAAVPAFKKAMQSLK
jgi:hypothetical protein